MVKFLAPVVLTALIAGSAWAACNLRCPANGGSEILCDGDSKFDALRRCGEPDFVEEVGFITSGSYGEISNATGTRGSYREFSKKVERWYYNCGDARFIKEVTFKGNEIVSIESTDRGSGPQKCW